MSSSGRQHGPADPDNRHPDRSFDDLPDSALLREEEYCGWFGIAKSTARAQRQHGTGPAFVQLSPRCIRYTVGAARKYIVKRTRRSTADDGADSRAN